MAPLTTGLAIAGPLLACLALALVVHAHQDGVAGPMQARTGRSGLGPGMWGDGARRPPAAGRVGRADGRRAVLGIWQVRGPSGLAVYHNLNVRPCAVCTLQALRVLTRPPSLGVAHLLAAPAGAGAFLASSWAAALCIGILGVAALLAWWWLVDRRRLMQVRCPGGWAVWYLGNVAQLC